MGTEVRSLPHIVSGDDAKWLKKKIDKTGEDGSKGADGNISSKELMDAVGGADGKISDKELNNFKNEVNANVKDKDFAQTLIKRAEYMQKKAETEPVSVNFQTMFSYKAKEPSKKDTVEPTTAPSKKDTVEPTTSGGKDDQAKKAGKSDTVKPTESGKTEGTQKPEFLSADDFGGRSGFELPKGTVVEGTPEVVEIKGEDGKMVKGFLVKTANVDTASVDYTPGRVTSEQAKAMEDSINNNKTPGKSYFVPLEVVQDLRDNGPGATITEQPLTKTGMYAMSPDPVEVNITGGRELGLSPSGRVYDN